MSDDETTIKIDGLDKLVKALKGKPPVLKVGILSGGVRSGDGNKIEPTNAEVGAFHEFGTSKLPVRSFLRTPLLDHLNNRLQSSGAFDADTLKQVVATGTFVPWIKKVGIVAEGIISDAFDSGGFGKWKPSEMIYKENHQTLVETTQLRNAITSEVKE